jgi:hypothetical protein
MTRSKKEKRPLNNNPAYRRFVLEKNKALEYLLSANQDKLSTVMADLWELIDFFISHIQHLARHDAAITTNRIDHMLHSFFDKAADDSIDIYFANRRMAYSLSYAGEGEAIGRALGRKTRLKLDAAKLNARHVTDSPFGGDPAVRIRFAFDKLRTAVVHAIMQSVLLRRDDEEMRAAVTKVFPTAKKVRKLKKRLRKVKRVVREAFKPTKPTEDPDSLTVGILDDDTWQQIVDQYLDANIPTTRGTGVADTVIDDSSGENVVRYLWEVEKDMTEDFVANVRAGQIDVAKENGIIDFQWIAVIDNKTDDCCLWRDGLSTTEIQKQLSGEHKDDECDGSEPPIHPYCRCDLAPLTDAEEGEPNEDLGDFETWLTR